ncbi:hypothetical protein [Pseudoxanthomonas wuyuanensis]|uniref:hypothetical protein n=1 Tax=Pseudoxanthomonas wuyuanensis TaxID=1073196 RepID=UPI00138A46B5|nr:hypothetical protein [Pseudoxanthomonas wuyuanensis]
MEIRFDRALKHAFLLAALLLVHAPSVALQPVSDADPSGGQHDFDWEIGTWKTELRRLKSPLSGSDEWVEYAGTSVVRQVLDGRANLVELRVEGPAGRIEGASLRLYNPHTEQWNLNYASARNGTLSHPVYGGFRNGRGEFYGQEDFDGRAVLVRFVISQITRDSARFEQAFSDDGGRTWEANWIAIDTRVMESD